MKVLAILVSALLPFAFCFWVFPSLVFNSSHHDFTNLIPAFFISFFSVLIFQKINLKRSVVKSFLVTMGVEALLLIAVMIFLATLPRV